MGILDDHEVKDRGMMEQSVELVANIGSVRVRGEWSCLLSCLSAELSTSYRCSTNMFIGISQVL